MGIPDGSQMRASMVTLAQALSLESPARAALHGLRRLKRFIVSADRRLEKSYFRSNQVTRLHIACGCHLLTGWLNSEYCPGALSLLRLDATKRFPFEDSVFDYVFSEHMIEHIDFAQGAAMLSEIHRVLKPNGTLRLSTPDLRFLLELYQDKRSPLQEAYMAWDSLQYTKSPPDNPVFIINNYMRNWGHTFIYDERTPLSSLEKAGFGEIRKCQISQSEHPELRNLENVSRMPSGFLEAVSMIFEATKSELVAARGKSATHGVRTQGD
ncbi:MAG: methyltransferase domain-containing protein [Bryobacteraceae bacterium]|jgi:predicted SAM-dependent methyltransferase